MSDLLITAALAAAVLLAVLAICATEPGGLARIPVITSGYRYHRAGLARHAVRAIEAAPLSALTTVPDGGPFAPRTA